MAPTLGRRKFRGEIIWGLSLRGYMCKLKVLLNLNVFHIRSWHLQSLGTETLSTKPTSRATSSLLPVLCHYILTEMQFLSLWSRYRFRSLHTSSAPCSVLTSVAFTRSMNLRAYFYSFPLSLVLRYYFLLSLPLWYTSEKCKLITTWSFRKCLLELWVMT